MVVGDFRKPEYETYGNPLPLIDTRAFLLSIGGGASYTRHPGGAEPYCPKYLYGSIFGTGWVGEKWYWFSYHAYGIASDRLQFAGGKADSYLQLTVAGYRISDNFLTGIGALSFWKRTVHVQMPHAPFEREAVNHKLNRLRFIHS
ncbi:MAG: hypothetical protein ACLFQB_07500 [Chitinispirillaceae bacterium]